MNWVDWTCQRCGKGGRERIDTPMFQVDPQAAAAQIREQRIKGSECEGAALRLFWMADGTGRIEDVTVPADADAAAARRGAGQ